MSRPTIPPILASVIARLTAAVPARARTTFLDLLLGAAATKGGHVTDAILAAGLSRGWSTYYWFLERGRWSWLRVWASLLEVLTRMFSPAVWYAVIDDSVVERVSTRAPGSLTHHNHNAKPNRPRFLRGQGWLCLAAVIERNDFAVGAVPLLLRLVRRGSNRGKLRSAGLLLGLLGQRLGRVRLLLDAWFMRAWLIHRALAAGHTVIGCVRRDLALFDVPKSPRKRQRGRPRKYGARLSPARVAALPEQRSAQILYGKLEVVRYRTCLVAARFLHGRVVRAVWLELERPDRPDKPRVQRLLICTDPTLSALAVIRGYAKRWAEQPKILWGWAAAGFRLRSLPPYLGDAQCRPLNICLRPPPVPMMPRRLTWTPRCSWRWNSACRAGSSWPARLARTRPAGTVLRPAMVRACLRCCGACGSAPGGGGVGRLRSL